jgi:very-short-patch-repair endonuclease
MSRYNKQQQHTSGEIIKNDFECRIFKNEDEPYTLFCASDVGKILKIRNIRVSISNYSEELKITINTDSSTGKKKSTYLTYEGLIKLLICSRKPETMKLAEKIGINIETVGYACVEAETIKCIEDCFSNETILREYSIKPYRVDLYFPEYHLIVECDENAHRKCEIDDRSREVNIIKIHPLVKFIRYKPQEKCFNIFELCGRIHNHIARCLRETD